MTPEQQALNLLAQLVALAPVPLEAHKQGQEALKILRELVLKDGK